MKSSIEIIQQPKRTLLLNFESKGAVSEEGGPDDFEARGKSFYQHDDFSEGRLPLEPELVQDQKGVLQLEAVGGGGLDQGRGHLRQKEVQIIHNCRRG